MLYRLTGGIFCEKNKIEVDFLNSFLHAFLYSFDFSILDFIQAHLKSGFGDAAIPIITALGNGGIIWIALAIVLLIVPKTRKAGLAVATSLALEAVCCNLILKPVVARARPCDVNQAVELLISRPSDYSFPSGHTGASFAAASALFGAKSKLWLPALILSILIGFSRLYLYVHYPTDVLAGAFLGTVLGLTVSTLMQYADRKKI